MHVERAADLYTMAMFVYKAAMCKPSGIPLTPPPPLPRSTYSVSSF